MRDRLAVLVATSALLLTSLVATRAVGAPSLADPDLSLTTIVTGFSGWTQMDFLGPHDILALRKQNGQVRRVLDGELLPAAVLDVPVNGNFERGLLGIAINTLDPPDVFLFYTEADVDGGTVLGNRLYRYTWNPTLGVLESPQLLLDLPATGVGRHNGGVLELGPTGEFPGVGDGSVLYVVTGDQLDTGQLQNDPPGPWLADTSVVLRILQDGSPAPGNPFQPFCSVTTTQTCDDDTDCPGESCRTEVGSYFAYGIRNSFGLTRDPVTGAIWDTENGQTDYDEVNLVAAGMNSGWVQIMGPDSRSPQGVADLFDMPGAGSTYSDPELSWLDPIAPTAIAFPVGSKLGAAYDDVALVGDYVLGQIYALPLNSARDGLDVTGLPGLSDLVADDPTERDQLLFGTGFEAVADIERGPDGAIYVLAFQDGAIHRIVGPQPAPSLRGAGLALTLVLSLVSAGALALSRARTA